MKTFSIKNGICELYPDEILKIVKEIDGACDKEASRVSSINGIRPNFDIYINDYGILTSFYQEKINGKYSFKEDFLGKTLDINATVNSGKRNFKTENLASLIMSGDGDGLTFFIHPVRRSLVNLEVVYPILKKYCSSIRGSNIDF